MDSRIDVLLALLVLLAGCNAPGWPGASPTADAPRTTPATQSATGSTQASPESTSSTGPITVVGGPVPADVNRVWRRVRALLGANVTPPESVVVRPPAGNATVHPSRFYTALTGIGPRTLRAGGVGGHVGNPDTVYVGWSLAASEPGEFERVLVREFALVVRFRRNGRLGSRANDSADLDVPFFVRAALLQGGAIYVAGAYTERYLDDARPPSTRLVERYRRASPVERYWLRQNYFGYRYVAARVDSSRNLSAVYRNPPRTTEELLHRLPPGSEPPANLRVTVDWPRAGEWLRTTNGTAGELFVRSVLATELQESTAKAAAAGWGNDRLVTFWNGTDYSYVWVLRWDDAANASEFATAFERFLDARGRRTDAGWRANGTAFTTDRLDSETVAVVVGERRFVGNVSVRASETPD